VRLGLALAMVALASPGAARALILPTGHVDARSVAPARTPSRRFTGTGRRRLGTITVHAPGARVRWTSRGGRFRVVYDGRGVAVDSRARSGMLVVPAGVYRKVTVLAGRRWTITFAEAVR
jgi:hypothetical protein